MKTRWWLVILLFAVIVLCLVILIAVPAPAHAPTSATSTPATSTLVTVEPLHTRVIVTSPVSGASVSKTFTVTGEAPGNWYFEASFPVQVRDADNNKVGEGIAQAQSDWMTTAQVPFKADITVTGYSGLATLVLLKDNPSGLPQNDDSLSIPVVIQ